jgi:hypothetical protein
MTESSFIALFAQASNARHDFIGDVTSSKAASGDGTIICNKVSANAI